MAAGTILIVEDKKTQQYVLRELCESFDYDVHIVSTGEEALEAVACSNYLAILLDLGLPDMDGKECARKIRELDDRNGTRTPLIAVTGRTEEQRSCFEAGIDDYLLKPFNPDQLQELILRHTDQEPPAPTLEVLKSPRLMAVRKRKTPN